jgi:hypothetical protein
MNKESVMLHACALAVATIGVANVAVIAIYASAYVARKGWRDE